MTDVDAIIIGAGPNGLTAAAVLAREGYRVVVFEAQTEIGGGTRSAELMAPGVVNDICSAVHPLAVASPAFKPLGLEDRGVEWIHPAVPAAHPLDGGRGAVLHRSVEATAAGLGTDAGAYRTMMEPLVDHGQKLVESLLDPFRIPPPHPLLLARFARLGIRNVMSLADRFQTTEARALLGGMAAHTLLPLETPTTAAFGLLLNLLGHHVGWPMPKGGSQRIAEAIASVITENGGEIVTDHRVASLAELPPARAVLADVTPRQLIEIAGDQMPSRYRRRLEAFRYGAGVFKIDWVLSDPIPWSDPEIDGAGTVHVGGTIEEMAASEAEINAGKHPDRPYVLMGQPSSCDPSRTPDDRQSVWAYTHVPHGSTEDRTDVIERQIERFAPGFRDTILDRHTYNTVELQAYNANYVGGDIVGGAADFSQFIRRPTLPPSPWTTAIDNVYLCSSSTPPGGGVHGMCGWHAAQAAMRRSLR